MLTYHALRENKDALFGEGSQVNIVKDSCGEVRNFKDGQGRWHDNAELLVCKAQIVKADGDEVEVEVAPFKIQVPRAEAEALISG